MSSRETNASRKRAERTHDKEIRKAHFDKKLERVRAIKSELEADPTIGGNQTRRALVLARKRKG